MKKIFGISLAWILASTVSFSQVSPTEVSETVSKEKTCIPTQACADKAGVTLEECKKICAGKTAAAEASKTNVASASMVADKVETKKACNPAACAAKCKASAKSANVSDDKNTKVAAAGLVNEVEEIPTEKTAKKACSKTCTKKKG